MSEPYYADRANSAEARVAKLQAALLSLCDNADLGDYRGSMGMVPTSDLRALVGDMREDDEFLQCPHEVAHLTCRGFCNCPCDPCSPSRPPAETTLHDEGSPS